MKNYFLIAFIAVVWQSMCIAGTEKTSGLTIESLLAIAVISADICKIAFENTAQPVHADVITKYFVVRQVMKDNGLGFLAVKSNVVYVNKEQAFKSMELSRQSMASLKLQYAIFGMDKINSDGFKKNSELASNVIEGMASYSMLPRRRETHRTFDLVDRPRLQKITIPLCLKHSDGFNKNSEVTSNIIKGMASHYMLPIIISIESGEGIANHLSDFPHNRMSNK